MGVVTEQERPRVLFVSPAQGLDEWRVHWPAQALMDRGWDVKVIATGSLDRDVDLHHDDVVIIHGINQDIGLAALIRYCRPHVRKVVVQWDDDWMHLDNVQEVNRKVRHIWKDIRLATKAAHATIVATPPLVEAYGQWSKVEPLVVRNYMPRRLATSGVNLSRQPYVGWMGYVRAPDGNPAPHSADMAEIGPALSGLTMWAVGDSDGVRALYNGAGPKVRGPKHGLAPETTLYPAMAQCRVAVAPLVQNEFNRAKSWIKPLEFAFCGVPSVLPVWHPAYRELQRHGIPMRMYSEQKELRDAIDEVLSMPDVSWQILSNDVQRTAMFACNIDEVGVESWEQAVMYITHET
jgi:glycosyltransferase involved in cell wall biosynthesis